MVDQVFEVECWRLTTTSGSKPIGVPKPEPSKSIRTKLSMPPLKHRSSSHTSTKANNSSKTGTSQDVGLESGNGGEAGFTGYAANAHGYGLGLGLGVGEKVDEERVDTFGTLSNGVGVGESKRREHSNIFRRFTSRNRTPSSSSSFSLSSTAESIPQSSTFSSLSTLVSPATDGFHGDVGGPLRQSNYPGSGSGLGRGLPSGQTQSNTGKQDQDSKHKIKSKSKSSKSTFPVGPGNKTSNATTSEREWTRIKMVLRGNMGLGPNTGLAGAQRRSSVASAGTGGASSGSGSGVKIEVFDMSLSDPRPLFSFDPTVLRSTDVSLPHKSLFPSRTDKVIRLTNLLKPCPTSILGGPPIGQGPTGWDSADRVARGSRDAKTSSSSSRKARPVALDLGLRGSTSPALTDGSASENWVTPMMSPWSADSADQGFSKHSGLPSRHDGVSLNSPTSPTFGLPSSETIRDLAQARRVQEQEALGRRAGSDRSSPRSPVMWYGTDTPAAGRFRTTRSKASNSSLRTNTTTESDDSWRSASDVPVLPAAASSPISTNFHWTNLDLDEEIPSAENGGPVTTPNSTATSKAKKRESMTPRANRVLQFPDRDSDGLDLLEDRVADEGEAPNDLLLTFATRSETYLWYALLKSYTSNEYITLVSGNDMSTNLTRNDARPSPSLYSAFSVNGTGSKAEWARIWRSLEIKIQDVKDLNLASPPWVAESNGLVNRPVPPKRGMLRSISSGFGQSLKGLMDEEEVLQKQEDTLYWSISVDGQTMARTPKRRVDTTTWTEVVKLEDIDEWHKCTLRLYRRTRFSNQPPETVCLGYVRVDARDLDADQTYEKKLPLLAFLTSDVLGQVRLSIKSDQLNIKGLAAYDVITQAIHSGDAKRIYKVAENASAEGGAAALCRIALSKGLLEPLICALIDEEVQTPSATLFRSNTPLTRCLEYIMRIQAVDYVRDTIGDEMRTLCSDTSLESGPISGASDVSVAVSRIWDKIYMSRHEFPPNLRWVFSYLLKAVARHHPNNKPLQLHSVSAFIFLRLIGPCIMWPETFGIVDFHPREEVEQKLKAIAKSLINLGFLIEPKEGDRSPLDAHFSGDFHRDNVTAMMDYLAVCASRDSPLHTNEDESHSNLRNALQTRRAALMPSHTDSEAVLHVTRQLLVDVAKDTAWLYRIREQKSVAEARKDSAASSAPKMRTVSMTSSQSGQSVSIGSSPQSRTSTLPTTNEGEPNPPETKQKSRRPGSSSSRPVLVGPPPIIGQRTSSINRQPVKMVSLGQPI